MAPILTLHSLDVISHSPSQTQLIGARLSEFLRPGDVVCLQGELGTGKTCLTQGIGIGLKVDGVINSPTFVFINEHGPEQGSGPYLYHADLYRIESYMGALAIGLEDYMYGDGITVIEWAEHALEIVPEERLWITLAYLDDTKRRLLFEGTGEHYLDVIRSLREVLYGPRKGVAASP